MQAFRQQHGADADAKIRDPRRAFADVRKRDGEICTRRDLEQDLRQIDTGQPSRDGGPQRHQRRGFLDLVEGAHDQLVLPVDAFETHGWIVGEARGHRAVGLNPARRLTRQGSVLGEDCSQAFDT